MQMLPSAARGGACRRLRAALPLARLPWCDDVAGSHRPEGMPGLRPAKLGYLPSWLLWMALGGTPFSDTACHASQHRLLGPHDRRESAWTRLKEAALRHQLDGP